MTSFTSNKIAKNPEISKNFKNIVGSIEKLSVNKKLKR